MTLLVNASSALCCARPWTVCEPVSLVLPGTPLRVLRDSTAQDCRGHHTGSSPPAAAAPRRDTASRPGQHLRETPRCVLLRCLSGCRLLLSEAGRSVPLCRQPLEQWPLCAGRRRAVSWSTMAARIRAVPPSPHRPCLCSHENPAHICCIGLCRTHSAACPSLLAHRAASTQPSAVRRRAATPCSPSAQHKSCSELALLDPIWDEGQSSAEIRSPARRLH